MPFTRLTEQNVQDVVITGRLDSADWGFSTDALRQIFTELYQQQLVELPCPESWNESVRTPARICAELVPPRPEARIFPQPALRQTSDDMNRPEPN